MKHTQKESANTFFLPKTFNGVNHHRYSLLSVLPYVLFSLLLFAFCAVLVAPYLAHAVEGCTTAFCPLTGVEEIRGSKLATLYNSDRDLVGYLNTLFKMAISAGAIIALLRLLYAGYTYMASDIWTSKETAKGIFREVFLGLFLLLSIWIILKQINPNLLNLDVRLRPVTPTTAPAPGTTPPAGVPVSADQARLNQILADEQNVRSLITNTASNIGINNGGIGRGWCTSVTQRSGCTNVGLLPPSVISKLSNLQRACNCDITITSGTEFWMHTTHGPGLPVVDLRSSTGLNNYLLGAGIAPSSGARVTKDGAQYTYETTGDNGRANGNHWHVRF